MQQRALKTAPSISRYLCNALIAMLVVLPVTAVDAGEAANAALARRFYVAFNARDLDSLDKFMAQNIVDHNPAPGQTDGLAGVKVSLRGFFALSSDIQAHNDLVIAKGDYVTVYSTATGTHTGDLLGVKATHKPFQIHTLDIWRVKDGKLAEGWHVEELLGILTQVGALPRTDGS